MTNDTQAERRVRGNHALKGFEEPASLLELSSSFTPKEAQHG